MIQTIQWPFLQGVDRTFFVDELVWACILSYAIPLIMKSKKSLALLHSPVFSVVYSSCNQEQPEMFWKVFFVWVPNIKPQKLCWINEKTPKWILFFLAIDHTYMYMRMCLLAVNNFSFCQLCYQQQSMVLRLWCVIDVSVRDTMEGPAEMKWGT